MPMPKTRSSRSRSGTHAQIDFNIFCGIIQQFIWSSFVVTILLSFFFVAFLLFHFNFQLTADPRAQFERLLELQNPSTHGQGGVGQRGGSPSRQNIWNFSCFRALAWRSCPSALSLSLYLSFTLCLPVSLFGRATTVRFSATPRGVDSHSEWRAASLSEPQK